MIRAFKNSPPRARRTTHSGRIREPEVPELWNRCAAQMVALAFELVKKSELFLYLPETFRIAGLNNASIRLSPVKRDAGWRPQAARFVAISNRTPWLNHLHSPFRAASRSLAR